MADMSTPAPKPVAQVQEMEAQLQLVGDVGRVEVDEDLVRSGYESGESTATTTLASSVFSFTYANGRRYHSDRFKHQYFMPNDENEQDRLDLYHHIFLSLLGGKLHIAPLDHPQKVLDVGTGTGIWAIDFADENPQAEVTGPDISPIQPSWVPPNCKFEVDDLEAGEWTWPNNHFDYIHMRSMSGSFRNWKKVLEQAYKKLASGGYIEFQDYSCQPFLWNGTKLNGINDQHPISTYMHHVLEASAKAKIELDVAPHAKRLLQEAGFVDLVEKTAVWPIGHWPKDKRLKEIGRFARLGSEQSAYPFGVQLLTANGWTVDEVKELCDKVIDSYNKGDEPGDVGKYYFQGWFVYGRKP